MTSTSSKKIFLCDVDGVCLDFTRAVCECLPEGVLAPHQCDVWDFFDPKPKGLLSDEHHRHVINELQYSDFWDSFHIIPGADKALEDIRRADIEVVAVTSPWDGCHGWGETRVKILQRLLGFKANQVIITPRKDVVRGDYFLDDKPEHIVAWREAYAREAYDHGAVIDVERVNARLFSDSSYNRDHALPRVTDWGHVLAWVGAE